MISNVSRMLVMEIHLLAIVISLRGQEILEPDDFVSNTIVLTVATSF